MCWNVLVRVGRIEGLLRRTMIDCVSCEILLRLATVSLAITIHETEQIHTMFMINGTSLRTYETNNWLDLDEPLSSCNSRVC